MIRRLLVLTAICLFAGALHAELTWDKPIQEYHRSPDDKFVEARFTFKNAGTAPVTVENVRTSCGCTSAELSKKTFAAGEKGDINVKFTFGGRIGGQKKTIRVFSSDRGDDPTLLELRVFIEEPLTVSPALVYWRIGEPSTAKTVQISAATEHPVRVKAVRSSNPRVAATLETQKPGEHYTVAIKPADTSAREIAEISVETDYPPDAPRTYNIHARIK